MERKCGGCCDRIDISKPTNAMSLQQLEEIYNGAHGNGELFYVHGDGFSAYTDEKSDKVRRVLFIGNERKSSEFFRINESRIIERGVHFKSKVGVIEKDISKNLDWFKLNKPELLLRGTPVQVYNWAEVRLTEENTPNEELHALFDVLKRNFKCSLTNAFPKHFIADVKPGEAFLEFEFCDCDHDVLDFAVILPTKRSAIISVMSGSRLSAVSEEYIWSPEYDKLKATNAKLTKEEKAFLKSGNFVSSEGLPNDIKALLHKVRLS